MKYVWMITGLTISMQDRQTAQYYILGFTLSANLLVLMLKENDLGECGMETKHLLERRR